MEPKNPKHPTPEERAEMERRLAEAERLNPDSILNILESIELPKVKA